MSEYPWLKTNAKKLIIHVGDHPGCSIWSVMGALWPYGERSKAKLRALRRKIPIGIFETGVDGWRLTDLGREIEGKLREGK